MSRSFMLSQTQMIERHIFMGLAIPIVFLLFGGIVRLIVRKEWLWSNFYLGIDATLAALANVLVNLVDAAHSSEQSQPQATAAVSSAAYGNKMYYSALYLVACIGVLLFLMAMHQAFEVRRDSTSRNLRVWRGICLGVLSNLVGSGMLGWFIIWKLRGTV